MLTLFARPLGPLITTGVAVLLAASAAPAGSVLYVDDDAPLGGNGLSWDTAYPFVQDALAVAGAPNSFVNEIRVAQGVYKPDRDEANPNGTGPGTGYPRSSLSPTYSSWAASTERRRRRGSATR